METLRYDIRYSLRALRKTPTFTAVAVFVLALAIGASTAVFSVVDAVLLRPLPYPSPERLVVLWEFSPKIPGLDRMWVSYPNFLDWRERNRSFHEMAVMRTDGANLTGGDEPARVTVNFATAGLFPVLGVQPALGRAFGPDDDRPGAPGTAVLSHAFWQGRLGGDPEAVGRTIHLDGEPFTVVGVMPAGFDFPEQTPRVEMWVPLGRFADAPSFKSRGNHPGLLGVARLEEGVTVDQARADMEAVAAQLGKEFPNSNESSTVRLHSLDEEITGDVRPALLVVFAAIVFVLLIACANVANLLLARASARHREVAIRAALGASRARVARQLLVESVLLATAGAALGWVLAIWGLDLLRALGPENLPRLASATLDLRVLGFTAALAVATGVLFGLAPAVQGSKLDVNEALKEGGRGVAGSLRRNRLRSALVALEFALALTLLVGAGLTLKSFSRLLDVSPGFEPDRVAVARVPLPSRAYDTPEKQRAFFGALLERARAIPGAESAGLVSSPPLFGGSWQSGLAAEDKPRPEGERNPLVDISIVSAGYFGTMGIPVHAGRDFADDVDGQNARLVALVDEDTARTLWPGESPIGKRVAVNSDASGNAVWREVVGVVGHVKLYALDAESRMQVYIPYMQLARSQLALVVRASGDPEALFPAIRSAVHSVDRNQPLAGLDTMSSVASESVAQRRFSMLLLSVFAGVALVLAAVGIYGVITYLVAQRTNEFGIRMALGASAADVLSLVLREGMALALVGLAAGVAASYAVSRVLASLLFEVSPTDPVVFGTVTALLAAVALLACFVPARRATRVDPVTALRSE